MHDTCSDVETGKLKEEPGDYDVNVIQGAELLKVVKTGAGYPNYPNISDHPASVFLIPLPSVRSATRFPHRVGWLLGHTVFIAQCSFSHFALVLIRLGLGASSECSAASVAPL